MNLLEFQQKFNSEQVCLDYLEHARWGDKAICPNCGSVKTYKFTSGRLFKCGDCQKQFTAKVGTIFSDSKVPLYKWYLSIYLATSLKKGISSIQLSKYIGVTQKTSWFMLQRIRYAIEKSGNGFMLQNEIEIDETYIHPNPQKNSRLKKPTSTSRFYKSETVFGMVERGGKAKIKHVKSSGSRTLLPQIQSNIRSDSTIYSDEWGAYRLLPLLGYPHETVKHYKREFKRGNVHTNNIEGFWSHLKRGIDGVYIHVSPKHLQKYCSEYEYRYNTRYMSDLERFSQWFSHSICRLTYKELING